MKKKDIFLDFTSLLDVTLIVIFFFVIFNNLDNQANKEVMDSRVKELESITEQKILELEAAIEDAGYSKAEAEKIISEYKNDLEVVKEANNRLAANLSEINNFQNSKNIKLVLDARNKQWSVKVIIGDELITTVIEGDSFYEDFEEAFAMAGYSEDDTIFCDFIFDGNAASTNRAVDRVQRGLTKVKGRYTHLYTSVTDISIGGEE